MQFKFWFNLMDRRTTYVLSQKSKRSCYFILVSIVSSSASAQVLPFHCISVVLTNNLQLTSKKSFNTRALCFCRSCCFCFSFSFSCRLCFLYWCFVVSLFGISDAVLLFVLCLLVIRISIFGVLNCTFFFKELVYRSKFPHFLSNLLF